jgi:formylglycine-generating enzyme required for sulfatase activity
MKSLTLILAICAGATSGFSDAVQLRMALNTNAPFLTASPFLGAGALFVYQAPDLGSLAASPALFFQTNTPCALWLPAGPPSAAPSQSFFFAVYCPGRSVSQFGGPALVAIPAGTFVMGSPPTEAGRLACEGSQTMVSINYSFKMGACAVTQWQYQSVVGGNPSYFSGVSNRPVEEVSWSDATNYCFLLTQWQRLAGAVPAGWAYRLPTEAEWEYACRAGTTTAFYYGPDLRSGMANFNGYYEYDAAVGTECNTNGIFVGAPVPVGGYAPNAWGLYDMHGNVWEWCLDSWTANLPGGSVTNPAAPVSGSDGVIRGGGWYDNAGFCRSAFRLRSSRSYRGNDTGFRVVLAPSP